MEFKKSELKEISDLQDLTHNALSSAKDFVCSNKYYLTAVCACGLVKLIDTATTAHIILDYGGVIETGPFLRFSMERLGVTTGLLAANVSVFAMASGLAYIVNYLIDKKGVQIKSALGSDVMYAFAGVYGLLSLNNLIIILNESINF